MEQLCMNVEALRSMHRFGDMMEEAIKSIDSETASFTVVREALDSIGRHWYGMRVRAVCKRSQMGFYFHVGLIYYPDTRIGLMIELDEKNNQAVYQGVVENCKAAEEFEINRAEAEYFKLFMPDQTFQNMSGRPRGEQLTVLRSFFKSGMEEVVKAANVQGFTLNYQNLSDALGLVKAFERTLLEVEGEVSQVKVNYDDKDNFSQYAFGYRYYLSDCEQTVSFYAYFGAIFSYKKQPAGIFAEIDRFSNPQVFDRVYDHLRDDESYQQSGSEPDFIKLFMPEHKVALWNQKSYEEQLCELKEFLKRCNDEMVKAYKRGGNEKDVR